MKKIISVLLALLIIVPAAAAAEEPYTPALGMTFTDFVKKYNQIPAPLDSPFKILTEPDKWNNEIENTATFYPEENRNIKITLYSKSPDQSMAAGLDRIGINVSDPADWMALLAITKRCMSVIYQDDYDIYLTKTIFYLLDYYHTHNLEKSVSGASNRFGPSDEFKLSLYRNHFIISKAD